MISKYLVTYTVDGVTDTTVLYAPSKKIAKEHFELLNRGIKIVSIKKQ